MLRETDRFCPACGLPQLLFVAAEAGVGESAGSSMAAGNSVGAMRGGAGILWRQALQVMLLVAVPAGVVCSQMGALDWIWIMLAAVWVVRLYARRTAPQAVTTGTGARLGLVTGLLTGWLVLAIECVGLWIQRYVLHQGSQIDADFERMMEPALRLNEQMLQGLGNAGDAVNKMHSLKAFLFSPEGRAGMLLAGSLMSAAIMVLFAVVGGALGARLAPRLRRPEA